MTRRTFLGGGTGARWGATTRPGPADPGGHAANAAPDEVADDLLLAGLGCGDPYAASAFVRRYQATVFGIAVAIVGSALAEDVAQEAFVRAWRHADSYDPRRGSVRSWITRITHNVAVDHVRRQGVPTLAPDDLVPLVASLTDAPERSVLARETVAELREALAALPPAQSRAVVMAGVLGLSAREIAQLEGIPVGTAKDRVHVAMAKLHAAMPERVVDV